MRTRSLPLLLVLLLSAATAVAGAQRSLTDLLPASTVLALEVDPAGIDAAALGALVADMELPAALQELAASRTGKRGGAHGLQVPDRCHSLLGSARSLRQGAWTAALGVSMPPAAAEPQLLLLVRPAGRAMSPQLLAGAVACLDGRRYAQQDSAAIYSLEAADRTLYIAAQQGVLALSTSTDLLRATLRLASGSEEASLAGTPAGAGGGGAGVSLLLNPLPFQAQLHALGAAAPQQYRDLRDRLLATVDTVAGYRLTLSLSAEAVSVTSSLLLAPGAGEEQLLALLTCQECRLDAQPPLPTGAVARSAGAVPLDAAVAWVDSWLADLARAGQIDPGSASVRGAAWRYLGIDLGALLLDWYEGAAYTTVLGVLDTDLTNWVQGVPLVTVMPVSSEEAAWSAVQAWVALARQSANAAGDTLRSQGRAPGFQASDALAVQQLRHDGVDVLRIRFGPITDVGLAVYDGQLVFGSPTSALLSTIQQRHASGAASGPAQSALGELQQGPPLIGYAAVDVSSFLLGASRIAELGAGSVATALVAGDQAARSGQFGPRATSRSRYLPHLSFEEALALTDSAVESLRRLARHLGVLTSTTSMGDGARVTTWRLPLLP